MICDRPKHLPEMRTPEPAGINYLHRPEKPKFHCCRFWIYEGFIHGCLPCSFLSGCTNACLQSPAVQGGRSTRVPVAELAAPDELAPMPEVARAAMLGRAAHSSSSVEGRPPCRARLVISDSMSGPIGCDATRNRATCTGDKTWSHMADLSHDPTPTSKSSSTVAQCPPFIDPTRDH